MADPDVAVAADSLWNLSSSSNPNVTSSASAAPHTSAASSSASSLSGAGAVGEVGETAIPSSFLGTLVPVRRTFIEEVPEDLRCPICYDGAANCSTRCGHSFCLHCLYSHITTRIIHQQSTACPLCRSANAGLGVSTISGEKSARTRALRVRCLGYEGGCQVEGPLSEVEKHETICPTVLIFCRFRDAGCSTPVLRKEASLHENRCRFNPAVRCCRHYLSGCKVRGIEELLQTHEPRCRYRNMQKFVNCRHIALGCGLRIRKQYRERHSDCCAFKILHEFKLRRNQQQQQRQQQEDDQQSETAEYSGNFASDGNVIQTTATTVERADDTTASRAAPAVGECADLCLALQWASPRALSEDILLGCLSNFLPNVSSISEGRFPGEFHVVLKEVPLLAVRSIGMVGDPNMSSNLSTLGLLFKGLTTVQSVQL
ncbi:zinc finger (C3HC4 type RING finger) protein, putative [Eimeria necatrix]|uniref:Zinc finger (C3HC4 type RING finger) protein, putative n=1 Tax=Eimeria necatrix TaxID=51315 RepID=U6MM69_9EIME|nr:zinc finger (C3HC4 type RING finger) protein, putative [Eimeria necatrix]CDJ63534.1 zinc finger (C3HC4 type RING finger) protein, putative [Eimeria necatrix]